jgi:hypothetical protein
MKKLLIFLVAALGLGASSAAAATTAPHNTTAPSISGTAKQGETLTADPGVWSGTQPIAFSYQWRRCDNTGANCANVIGATAKTYKLGSADVGNTLRVRVTAKNSAGSASVVSAATSVVASPPPQSVTLTASRDLIVYGGSVVLTGAVANGTPGETVTITEKAQASTALDTTVTTTTDASGSFTITVQPRIHTAFVASAGSSKSDPVDVVVRPRVQLRHMGFHRFAVRVSAARPLLHRVAIVQRWNRRLHVWVSIRRVHLTSTVTTSSPTVVSTVGFRLRHLSGVRIRVMLPLSQTVPGYITGTSGALSV